MARFNFTKRQIIVTISVLYLLLLTILAAYALYLCNYYSLPISNLNAAFTVALPPLAGLALETVVTLQYAHAAKGTLRTSKIFQAVNAFFLIYETVLATLAGTHMAPLGGLYCPLQDRWKEMFIAKDEMNIRRIQDSFNCCGFESVKAMAWPFPGNGRGADACVLRFDRTQRCLEPWRKMEQQAAILLLIVPVGVFVWKLALFLAPGYDTIWLPSALRLPRDDAEGQSGQNVPAITYRDAEVIDEEGEADSVRAEIGRLNRDSSSAAYIEGNRAGKSPFIQQQENFWARE